jgi:SAM-dependent methyltransferase
MKKQEPNAGPPPVNDLELARWREYEDILTDSLWLIPERDRSGAHQGDYHGNFIPQIPYQAMRRYTRQGDAVLDLFLGSGTTLIECRRLGRHGVGVELNPEMAQAARQRVEAEANPFGVMTEVLAGDSGDAAGTSARIAQSLQLIGREQAQLAVLHPPYHRAIRFSDRPGDLSRCGSVEEFVQRFGSVVEVADAFLEAGRHLVLVIGDLYADGEWIPLGFRCMEAVRQRGYRLKSIVVKDMRNNRAKRNLENIWRYRALAGGFYIFRHEYVMFFQKSRRK